MLVYDVVVGDRPPLVISEEMSGYARLTTSKITSSPTSGATVPWKMCSPIFRNGIGVSIPCLSDLLGQVAYDELVRRFSL